MSKKYEFIEREFYPKSSAPLIDTLNGYGEYGYQVVSATPVMFLDNPMLINKWVVIFMKEKGDSMDG